MEKWIYKITNLVNNKIYIGQSKNPKIRWYEHCRLGEKLDNSRRNTYLYQAINKYGKENFIIEILEGPIENYNEREIYWINYYDSCNRNKGYNLTQGGEEPPILTGEKSTLSFYSDELVDQLQNLLLYTDRNYKSISEELKVSEFYVSLINRGIIRVKNNLNYPLRKNMNKRIEKEKIQEIILSLLYTTDSILSISKEYNVSTLTVDRVNKGEHYHCIKEIEYPIREQYSRISSFILKNIFKDLSDNKLKLSDIEKKYNLSKATVNRINQGKRYKQKDKQYPIRSSKQRVYN